MANLQVKNVPPALHRKLRSLAKRRGRSLRDVVLEMIVAAVEREDFRAQLRTRAKVDLARSAALTLDEVRSERDGALAR